jgi:hypothetical protein
MYQGSLIEQNRPHVLFYDEDVPCKLRVDSVNMGSLGALTSDVCAEENLNGGGIRGLLFGGRGPFPQPRYPTEVHTIHTAQYAVPCICNPHSWNTASWPQAPGELGIRTHVPMPGVTLTNAAMFANTLGSGRRSLLLGVRFFSNTPRAQADFTHVVSELPTPLFRPPSCFLLLKPLRRKANNWERWFHLFQWIMSLPLWIHHLKRD